MTRKRVLFVDDEVQVLEGLQNLLRKERRAWDMVFCESGTKALDELAKAPFDVIVSDMRMPGIDGPTLLARVKDEYPSIARLVLSGHADRDAIERAIPVAHQFMSKPCDSALLRSTIERTCGLQAVLHNDAVRKVVGRLERLPSAPATYFELTRVLGRPDAAIDDAVAIIERDPAMVAKILQLVNSAYFGLAQHITSVKRAVSYLGLDLLKGLALSAHVFEAFPEREGGFSIEALQAWSLRVARLAKRLVPDPARRDDAFSAGIVHDIGRIVLAMAMPQAYARVHAGGEGTVSEREHAELGLSHAEAGAYLLGVWGLPITVVEAAAHHHRPSDLAGNDLQVLAAVHAASVLLDRPEGTDAEAHELDAAFLARAGMPLDLARWRAMAAEERRGGKR